MGLLLMKFTYCIMVVLLVWIYIEIEYFWFGNGMRNNSFGLDMYLKNCIFGLEMLYYYLFSFGLLKISCIFAVYLKDKRMFERIAIKYLRQWAKKEDRKPLVLRLCRISAGVLG